MPLTPTEIQAIASTESAKIAYLSLHTGDPGTTGANEASGGSPAYARKSTTVTATNGTGTSTQVTFDVPANTYTHFGCWSAATAGTFYGGNPLATAQTISSQGQIKLTVTLPVTAS